MVINKSKQEQLISQHLRRACAVAELRQRHPSGLPSAQALQLSILFAGL